MAAKKDGKLNRIMRYADLIQKQTGKAVRPFRMDGYVNLLNKYGTSKDTTERYQYQPEPTVPDDLITMFYEGNGLFARIIDTPAEEAIKHGFTLEGLSDKKIEDFYTEALDELGWEETAMTAIKWARLFGGAIGVMLINDGRGLEEPLDWNHIRSIDDIRVYDRSVITPDYSNLFSYDPREPFGSRGSRLGMPEYYDVYSRYGSFRVHDSRCLIFQNGVLPENTTNTIYQLWGVPEYVRINKAIRDAEVAHGSAVKLLDRSVQAIYKMKDLSQELATEDGEANLLRRLQTIDMARGLLNSIVIDSDGEEYDFRSFSYSGVSEVINTTCNYLSALTSIPQTILFGRSPAGMNSTGESDMENYYNFVERIERRMVKPNLRYLLSVIFQAGLATGEIDEVPPIKIKFNPLWSMSEADEIALEQQKVSLQQARAQTAQVYVEMQAIDPSEVRKKLADSGAFDVETMLDDYTPEELEANAPKGEGEGAPGAEMPPAGGMPAPGEMPAPGGTPAPGGAPAPGGMPAPGGAPAPGGMPDAGGAPEADDFQSGPAAPETAPEAGSGEPGAAAEPPEEPEEKPGLSLSGHKGLNDAPGKAPTAAPTATKLPQDMTAKEKKRLAENLQRRSGDEPAEEPEKQKPDPQDGAERPDPEKLRKKAEKVPERSPETPTGEAKEPEEKPSASVCILSVRDGRILCAAQRGENGKAQLTAPTGYAVSGESPKEAAARVLREQFGVEPGTLLYIGRGMQDERSGLAPHLFLCPDPAGEPACRGELKGPKWLALKDLTRRRLAPAFQDALKVMQSVLRKKAGGVQPEAIEGRVEEIRAKRAAEQQTVHAGPPGGPVPEQDFQSKENETAGKARKKVQPHPEQAGKETQPAKQPVKQPAEQPTEQPVKQPAKQPAKRPETPPEAERVSALPAREKARTAPERPRNGQQAEPGNPRKELPPDLLRQVREIAGVLRQNLGLSEDPGGELPPELLEAIAGVVRMMREREAPARSRKSALPVREIEEVVGQIRNRVQKVPKNPLDTDESNDRIEGGAVGMDGGPGSGYHAHPGNPGHRGGSVARGSATGANIPCTGFSSSRKLRKHIEKHGAEFPGMNADAYQKSAIEFLQQPCGGDIDGYIARDGRVVRFNRATGEYAAGTPGGYVNTFFKAGFDEKRGQVKLPQANRYFDRLKKKEAVPDENGGAPAAEPGNRTETPGPNPVPRKGDTPVPVPGNSGGTPPPAVQNRAGRKPGGQTQGRQTGGRKRR